MAVDCSVYYNMITRLTAVDCSQSVLKHDYKVNACRLFTKSVLKHDYMVNGCRLFTESVLKHDYKVNSCRLFI